MRTVAFCEIKPFCRAVLAKHWPHVPCYDDVRTLSAERLAANAATGDVHIDVICGGFPCQDVSLAGARAGLDVERSGLWSEYARIIGEVRPGHVIVENTPGLLSLGMGTVLSDLAALGYDAEWHCIPASAVGADHIRDRVWIIAYPNVSGVQIHDERWWQPRTPEMGEDAADLDRQGKLQPQGHQQDQRRRFGDGAAARASDAHGSRSPRGMQAGSINQNSGRYGTWIRLAVESANDFPGEHWDHKPILGRGVHGIPDRLDRIESLGNSVVPQVPEIIGRAIMKAMQVQA
jgi:DNA (cytosine-5)-methyltransferase 1